MKRRRWRWALYAIWLALVGISVGLALVRTTTATFVDSVLVVLLALGMLIFFVLTVTSSLFRSEGIKSRLQDLGMFLVLWAPALMLARMLTGLVQSGAWLTALIVAWFVYIFLSAFFDYLKRRARRHP